MQNIKCQTLRCKNLSFYLACLNFFPLSIPFPLKMAKGERTLTWYTMFFPESIRKKDIMSDHPAVTNWDDGWPLQVWWIYFPRLNKEPVYCWHTILTSFPEHGDDTLYLNCSIWLRSRSKVRLHVCGGCIEVDKVSLCAHARGRNAAEPQKEED